MDFSFEWEPRKALGNRRKHGVAFEEAIPVFGDPLARIFDDPDHSRSESREIIIGHCVRGRLLVVASLRPARRSDPYLQRTPRDTTREAGL
jgi:uncharacterized DUF497 family protein